MSEVLLISTGAERAALRPAEGFDAALLNRIAGRISSAAPLAAVLDDVVEFVTSVVKCDSCFVYLLEDGDLVLRASRNPHPELVNRLRLKLGQGITGWVAEHREPVVVASRACADPRFKMFNDLPEDTYEGFLSVPMVSGGGWWGSSTFRTAPPMPTLPARSAWPPRWDSWWGRRSSARAWKRRTPPSVPPGKPQDR